MMKILYFTALAIFFPYLLKAQDDLIKKLENNRSYTINTLKNVDSDKKFQFTQVIDLEHTGVKDQGSSGTCWSYSTNSFLESEMIRLGKQPVELSQIFNAHFVYIEKADAFVKMHGGFSLGDGGECHDVINMYAKYGAMPQEAYTGLQYGTTKNKFAEMQAVLKGMLTAVVSNPNGKLSTAWKKAYSDVLNDYLGAVPEKFEWHNKWYTPKSFAAENMGINPDDYIEVSSFTTDTYYRKSPFLVPDNWALQQVYNVKMNDLTDIVDYALNKGFTVSWATDVSEKYFSWKNGVAYVPVKEYEDMDDTEKKYMFDGPKDERIITPEMRQLGYDNYSTTDDHGMHIVGMAKDQNGKIYYKVKNSWGIKNDYKGYIYVTKTFVQYKTTALLLHKEGIPVSIRKKMNI